MPTTPTLSELKTTQNLDQRRIIDYLDGLSSGAVSQENFSGVKTITAGTTPYAADDCVILGNAAGGNVTYQLPAPSSGDASSGGAYRIFRIKKIDSSSNTVTLESQGGGTIDGNVAMIITQQYTSLTVITNGIAWYVL